MDRMVRQFRIERDEQGYAMALAVDDWFLIHLQRGTVRNEENADKLLAVLNAAVANVNNPAWAGVCDEDVALEEALQDIMPNKEPHRQEPAAGSQYGGGVGSAQNGGVL